MTAEGGGHAMAPNSFRDLEMAVPDAAAPEAFWIDPET